MLSFFPLDVLVEIWDVNESVSEGFLTYSSMSQTRQWCIMPTDLKIPLRRFCKADLDQLCLKRLHESGQTTVYNFETSYATKRICP